MGWRAAFFIVWCLCSFARGGVITLSEVLYDAAGSDDGGCFVEIFGPADRALDGYVLEGVNGRGGAVTHRVGLGGLRIPADGFLVVADADPAGKSRVPEADVLFGDLDFQNGPDSIRLLFGTEVVDALGYGSFGDGLVFAGEGSPAVDVAAGESLARIWANVDTQDNQSDFQRSARPDPGRGPVREGGAVVPEPGAWVLFGAGLGAVAAWGRRRSRLNPGGWRSRRGRRSR